MITWLLELLKFLLLFPFQLFRVISRRRRREILKGLPSLIVLATGFFTVGRAVLQQDSIISSYRTKAQVALRAGDFEAAKTYLGRVVNESEPTSNDLFNWAMALINTDSAIRGNTIIDQLAPDNQRGLPVAHQFKAIKIGRQGIAANDSATISTYRFHLDQSPSSPQVSKAWANYFVLVNDLESAIPHMERAATLDPQLLVSVAELYKQLKDDAGYRTALGKAQNQLSDLLRKDPPNNALRIALANIENRLKNFDFAESILLDGRRINDQPDLRSALASFYVNQHDLALKKDVEFQKRLDYLRSALVHDVNHIAAYDRLITSYRTVAEAKELASIRSELETSIATGKSPALSHFSLSNILWIEGDIEQAQWHMEQAYRHNNAFSSVANNLAWLLVNREPPELERAYSLSKSVVDQVPDNPVFRDTLGTVLLKQENYDEAAIEFEKCLKHGKDLKVLHQKLAFVYQKLNKPNFVRKHEEAIQQLDANETRE